MRTDTNQVALRAIRNLLGGATCEAGRWSSAAIKHQLAGLLAGLSG